MAIHIKITDATVPCIGCSKVIISRLFQNIDICHQCLEELICAKEVEHELRIVIDAAVHLGVFKRTPVRDRRLGQEASELFRTFLPHIEKTVEAPAVFQARLIDELPLFEDPVLRKDGVEVHELVSVMRHSLRTEALGYLRRRQKVPNVLEFARLGDTRPYKALFPQHSLACKWSFIRLLELHGIKMRFWEDVKRVETIPTPEMGR